MRHIGKLNGVRFIKYVFLISFSLASWLRRTTQAEACPWFKGFYPANNFFKREVIMIPALKKEYYPESMPEPYKWQEYERLKIDIIKKARTHSEYQELCLKLLDEMGL